MAGKPAAGILGADLIRAETSVVVLVDAGEIGLEPRFHLAAADGAVVVRVVTKEQACVRPPDLAIIVRLLRAPSAASGHCEYKRQHQGDVKRNLEQCGNPGLGGEL